MKVTGRVRTSAQIGDKPHSRESVVGSTQCKALGDQTSGL